MDNVKILVIEDEHEIRKNLETILTESGYTVISSSDGTTGIKLAKSDKPNLIICDIMMPGMDGYNVLDELSKEKTTCSIPFIFLTAKTNREDIRLGMKCGADDYLLKPFLIDELLNAVEGRLKRIQLLKSEDSIDSSDNPKQKYNENDKLFIQVRDKPYLITIKDIIYICADNQYTQLNMIDSNSFLVRKSISGWQEILPDKFMRIHRSTIINSDYIQNIEKWFKSSFQIYLEHIEKPFIVSRSYSSLIRKNKLD